MTLQWRHQLSVGNNAIDADHQHLIKIINQAEICLHEKSLEKLTAVFGELMTYSKEHFAREELIANEVGYPKVDQLHESHDGLVVQLDKIKDEIGNTWTDEVASHFTALLRSWLMVHVIKEDLPMKSWLVKAPPDLNPEVQKISLTPKEPEPEVMDFGSTGELLQE